jgi:hypothetical protein
MGMLLSRALSQLDVPTLSVLAHFTGHNFCAFVLQMANPAHASSNTSKHGGEQQANLNMDAKLVEEAQLNVQPRWHILHSWADSLQLKVATGGASVEEPCMPVKDDIPRCVCLSGPTQFNGSGSIPMSWACLSAPADSYTVWRAPHCTHTALETLVCKWSRVHLL